MCLGKTKGKHQDYFVEDQRPSALTDHIDHRPTSASMFLAHTGAKQIRICDFTSDQSTYNWARSRPPPENEGPGGCPRTRQEVNKRPNGGYYPTAILPNPYSAPPESWWPSNQVKSMSSVAPTRPALRALLAPAGNLTANVSAVEQHSFAKPPHTCVICGPLILS